MYDICKNYVEDCCNDIEACPYLGEDNLCHKNLVEHFLEKVFNVHKTASSEKKKFVYIVKNPQLCEMTDALVLRRLGHEVTIQEKQNNFYDQLRRAEVLADYVYVEEDLFDETGYLALPASRNINAAGPDFHFFTNCRNLGLINFLDFNDIPLYQKRVLIYGEDEDLVKKLVALGAIVTISTNKNLESRNFDLIIALEKDEPLNCYPVHIPVIDVAKCCINTEMREVVSDCHWFSVLGVLGQIW